MPKLVIQKMIEDMATGYLEKQVGFHWSLNIVPAKTVRGEISVWGTICYYPNLPHFTIEISDEVANHMNKAFGNRVWAVRNWVNVRIGHVIGHCRRATQLYKHGGIEAFDEYMANEFTCNELVDSFTQLQWIHGCVPESVVDESVQLTMLDYAFYYINWKYPKYTTDQAITFIRKEPRLAEVISVEDIEQRDKPESIKYGLSYMRIMQKRVAARIIRRD